MSCCVAFHSLQHNKWRAKYTSFNFVAVTRFLAEASDEGSRDRDSHDVSIFFPLLRLHNTSQPCTQSKQLFVSLAMGRIIDLSEFSLTSSCLLC
jgi:hypothetical protein